MNREGLPQSLTNGKPTQVLIVEDDIEVARLIHENLSNDPRLECLPIAQDVVEARRSLSNLKPDVILLDLRLGQEFALGFIQEIRFTLSPEASVLIYTSDQRSQVIFQALRNGANGYIFKPASGSEIVEFILAASRGESPMSPEVSRLIVAQFHEQGKAEGLVENLSPRERQILSLLSEGLTYIRIADETDIAVATVRTHLNRIYKKLHVNSRGEASNILHKSQQEQ